MRPIASALLLGLFAFVPHSALQAAAKDNPSALQAEVTLQDGSRIKGEIVPNRPLEVSSPVVGNVAVALDKIASITFGDDHKQTTLSLGNGDKLQGALSITSVDMTTLFGPIKIPLSAVKELRLHSSAPGSGKLSLDDWEPVPFPENSDWPAFQGEPATITDGVISIRGQPFRTKRTCTTPMTIECDVVLENFVNPETSFHINFLPADQPRNLNLVRYVAFHLSCSRGGGGGLRCVPNIVLQTSPGSTRSLWTGDSFMLRLGKTYHLKLRVTPSDMTVALNDNEYQIQDTGIPYNDLLIDLHAWQPSSTWLVKNLNVY